MASSGIGDDGGPSRRFIPEGIFFLISSLHLCPEPGRSHGQVAGAGLSLHLHKLPLTLLVTDSMSASALSPTYHCRQVSSSSSLHSAYTIPFYLSFQQEITYLFVIAMPLQLSGVANCPRAIIYFVCVPFFPSRSNSQL